MMLWNLNLRKLRKECLFSNMGGRVILKSAGFDLVYREIVFLVTTQQKVLKIDYNSQLVVMIKDITDVRTGQKTEVFERHRDTTKEDLSFSILYINSKGEDRSLDLVC